MTDFNERGNDALLFKQRGLDAGVTGLRELFKRGTHYNHNWLASRPLIQATHHYNHNWLASRSLIQATRHYDHNWLATRSLKQGFQHAL